MLFCCSFTGTNVLNLQEIDPWTNWQPCSRNCYDIGNPPVRQRYQNLSIILPNNTVGRYENIETQICEDVPLCNLKFGKSDFVIDSIHCVKTFLVCL